jgi:UDP-N-acetyl-2-amino-2-deoxyglucuronate dehydrogenase
MDKLIKFAVLGCGHIGKRHAEMIRRNAESELVALIDTDLVLEQPLYKEYSTPFFSSLEEFLESGIKADVISIATPNGLHAAQAAKAMESGHHVVIEKPICLTAQDCERLIAISEKTSKHIFCVMQNRYSPPSRWLKDMVTKNVLGDIYMVQVNCYWNRDERYYKPGNWHGTKELDGGTLFTQFSHFIDLMHWLFDDIEDIKATFANHNHQHLTDFEDSGFINFKFLNGGIGCINYSTSVWDKNFESSITIIAENGSLKIGGQYMDKIEYCCIKNYDAPILNATSPAYDYGQYKGSAANHHFVIENVVDVLKGRAEITTNAGEGLKTVDIIERIYQLKKQEVEDRVLSTLYR